MNNRINLLLQAKNITAKQFAEEIGVQPSGMSHIMSGRNNPSLDFVMKVVKRYPEVNIYWLMFGKGEMYETGSSPVPVESVAPEPAAPQMMTPPAAPTPNPTPQFLANVYQKNAESSRTPKKGNEKSPAPSNSGFDLFSSQGITPNGDQLSNTAMSQPNPGVSSSQSSTKRVVPPTPPVQTPAPTPISTPPMQTPVSTPIPNTSLQTPPTPQPITTMPPVSPSAPSAPAPSMPPMGQQTVVSAPYEAPISSLQQNMQQGFPPLSAQQQAAPQMNIPPFDPNLYAAFLNENRSDGAEQDSRPNQKKRIVKFIVLYDDHSFSEYYPENM